MLWARVIWKELGHRIYEDVIPRTWINREKGVIYWPDVIKDERKAMEGKLEIKMWKEFTLIKFIIESDDEQLCRDYAFSSESESEKNTKDDNVSNKLIDFAVAQNLPVPPLPFRGICSSSLASHHVAPPTQLLTSSSQPKLLLDLFRIPSSESGLQSQSQTFKNKTINSRKDENMDNIASKRCKLSNDAMSLESDFESGGSSALHLSEECLMPLAKYQKKTLSLLIEIRDGINTLLKVNKNNESSNDVNMIMDVETLEIENNRLKNMDVKKILVEKLKAIGGDNFERHTRNIITKLFSVELRSKMNMKGKDRKGSLTTKIAFDKLEYSSVIYGEMQLCLNGTMPIKVRSEKL
nr:uncharacterized protein LOC124814341 isoform X2 [Hydra vulgaris]